MVGLREGDVDGDVVGDFEGDVEGDAEGDVLGEVDGAFEGDVDGAVEGDAEGDVEGDVEGALLGDVVGEAVTVKMEVRRNKFKESWIAYLISNLNHHHSHVQAGAKYSSTNPACPQPLRVLVATMLLEESFSVMTAP